MDILKNNSFLREVQLKKETITNYENYPFSLPAVKKLESLTFHPNVTFIIGENGTGKSTILEAIAISLGFNPEGGSKNFNFKTSDTHSNLFNHIKLVKGIKKPKTGYFLRAESFYNVASNIDELDKKGGGRPLVLSYGGKSLHKQSHGESFMSLLMNRFSDNGLYILDEPEAALSPSRKLAVLKRIDDLVNDNSQFIIATHSPIIMAYPKSKVYSLTENGYEEIDYKESEQFINKRFFKRSRFIYETFI
jgi:predicted ATPase